MRVLIIQLMQIREPLESDWDGCIKDIYIKYILRSIINVRPILYVDLDWANVSSSRLKLIMGDLQMHGLIMLLTGKHYRISIQKNQGNET